LDLDRLIEEDSNHYSGLVAMGGEFVPELLLNVYKKGIFPWPENEYIKLWFCPETRCVLYPDRVKVSKSMRKILLKNQFEISIDKAFERVINSCAEISERRSDTWITKDLKSAFIELNEMGYAHSFEVWENKELVGGLYGLSIGKQFSGESMFHRKSNASKVAFIFLARVMKRLNFDFIDCQVPNEHLLSLGSETMLKSPFLSAHEKSISKEGLVKNWS